MTRDEEEIQEEVNGLAMDMELTREQLIEKFGGGESIQMPMPDDLADDEQQGSVNVI